MQFCMQSEGSTPKKANVVETRMVFLFQLRGAFFQSARAESCTFPILTISSPFEPGLPRPDSQAASQPASQNSACMIARQIRKIQSIFVHAVHARGLPAWLAAEMVRSADFDPRAQASGVLCPNLMRASCSSSNFGSTAVGRCDRRPQEAK